jgi:hypothetical protein
VADLVAQLLARTGRYVGGQTRPEDGAGEDVARITVTALPGGSGVMLAYEVLSTTGEIVHDEHAVLARTTGGTVLITSHSHDDVTVILHEDGDGHFPATAGATSFPMAIDIEVPEPGRLIYKWFYGWADKPMSLRDVGDLRAVG